MKKICLLILLMTPLKLGAGVESFSIDYFGFPLQVECRVERSGLEVDTFERVVSADMIEARDCVQALLKLSADYRISGYAQVLLFWRFVDELPSGYDDSELSGFAEAALRSGELSREGRLALYYAMLSQAGFEVAVNKTDDRHFLILKLSDRVRGMSFGSEGQYYAWEPGHTFDDLEAVGQLRGSENILFHPGREVSFDRLPKLPWPETGRAEAISFNRPEGCPETLRFSVERLPNYERFLALWPRDKLVVARLSRQMFAPFGFEKRFKTTASAIGEIELANCLLRWVQINSPYDFEHAAQWRPDRMRRNPVETLFLYRSGICDELSLTLLGLLRHAGFSADRFRLVIWKREGEVRHMNLALRPTGASPGGKCVTVSDQKFFMLDPAYYMYDQGRLVSGWGWMADVFEDPALYPVPEK